MTEYAKIEQGKVVQVIICEPEFIKNYTGIWIKATTKVGIGYDYSQNIFSRKKKKLWDFDLNMEVEV